MSDRDITTGGHPRTLRMHQELRMRAQQRAALTNEKPVTEMSGLHVDTVVRVSPDGGIMLSRFQDADTGLGQFFYTLNFTSPRVGDVVVYSYADDTPIVLGKMPSERTPWRVPEWHEQDNYFFDDMDLGGNNTAGHSLARWLVTVANSGSVAPHPGTYDRPGQLILSNIASVGSYAIMYPSLGAAGFAVEGFDQIGFNFLTTNSQGGAAQTIVGLIDSSTVTQWIALFASQSTFFVGWNTTSPAASASVETGVQYVDSHWYKLIMNRVAPGTWQFFIIDVTDETVNGPFILNNCPTTVAMFPMVRLYNLTGTGARTCFIDYVWWSRRMLPR